MKLKLKFRNLLIYTYIIPIQCLAMYLCCSEKGSKNTNTLNRKFDQIHPYHRANILVTIKGNRGTIWLILILPDSGNDYLTAKRDGKVSF